MRAGPMQCQPWPFACGLTRRWWGGARRRRGKSRGQGRALPYVGRAAGIDVQLLQGWSCRGVFVGGGGAGGSRDTCRVYAAVLSFPCVVASGDGHVYDTHRAGRGFTAGKQLRQLGSALAATRHHLPAAKQCACVCGGVCGGGWCCGHGGATEPYQPWEGGRGGGEGQRKTSSLPFAVAGKGIHPVFVTRMDGCKCDDV